MGTNVASNFSFHPMGLSTQITVTAAASTFSLSVVQNGGTTLTFSGGGNYVPQSIRVANPGSIAVFLSFGGNSTVTTGLSGGLMMLPTSVEVFGVNGTPFMAVISGGTTTVNITPGEGQ